MSGPFWDLFALKTPTQEFRKKTFTQFSVFMYSVFFQYLLRNAKKQSNSLHRTVKLNKYNCSEPLAFKSNR